MTEPTDALAHGPRVTTGRIVRFVLDEGSAKGQVRPAIVTDPIDENMVQLQVFTDSDPNGRFNDGLPSLLWKTSIPFNAEKEPGTWHWPDRR